MKKLKTLLLILCLTIPFTFIGCENKSKNSLSAPTALNVQTDGKISFLMVENAEYYTITINDFSINVFANSDASSGKVERIDNYLIYDASKILTLGKSYDIKVKANATDKVSSPYSNTVTYRHALSVDKPSNIKINGTTITWDTVEHASYYVIKVLAPYDNLKDDTVDSIASSDLTEYRFTSNKFNFGSLLRDAGEYKIYIKAVSLESDYTESEYTFKTVYKHNINIATPQSVQISKVTDFNEQTNELEENFHLTAIVDDNAEFVEIKYNENSVVVDLTAGEQYIKQTNNLIDVNLNRVFEDKSIDFGLLTTYTFAISAGNSVTDYIKSEFSSPVTIENFERLNAPVVEDIVADDLNGGSKFTWQAVEGATGYKLYIFTSSGQDIKSLDADVQSYLLKGEFDAVAVQAIGKGNVLPSVLSEIKSNNTNQITGEINFSIENNKLTWTDIPNATYVVEIDTETIVTKQTFVDLAFLTKPVESMVKVHVLSSGFAPATYEMSLKDYRKELSKPTFGMGQGFSGTSLYVLSFNAVQHAIGYKVYINDIAIDKIFTTTTINLAKHITTGGEYLVKVQAVAGKYDIYKNSTFSNSLSVVHEQVLSAPQFIDGGIEKVAVGEGYEYYLNFQGVGNADRYEILINHYPLSELGKGSSKHRVNITNYLKQAGDYTIMVRSMPVDGETNLKPSVFSVLEPAYRVTKQLDDVTNIKVNEREGIYTLSFDTQANANSYQVRILKLNDSTYSSYLEVLGLHNPFTVYGACDISAYLKQAGEYYVYITAIAPEDSAYVNSDESKSYASINKLTTLKTPTNIEYNNASSQEFLLRWEGDEFADYYIVTVTDPNKIVHEFTSVNPQTNINNCITVQGAYVISVRAYVDANGENSIYYSNSPESAKIEIDYKYELEQDFTRYSIFMNGKYYNYKITNVNQLKNILYYHYLYTMDNDYPLRIMVGLQDGDMGIIGALTRMANECKELGIYDFSDYTGSYNTQAILTLISEKIIDTYPELHVLDGDVVVSTISSNTFQIKYKNKLNATKVTEQNSANVALTVDYGNTYNYLPIQSRRSQYTTFAIDSKESMYVTTTEQLLHAVQYGKKPVFVGDSAVAKQVYENAKRVLVAIANNNMNDYEKTTAIFDWLSYALNLNHKSEYYLFQQESIKGGVENYGLKSEYYLEGVFYNLLNSENNGYDKTFYLGDKRATSESYSKAFTLLAGIEGIETRKVNGTYTYIDNNYETVEKRHNWNKVKLGAKWYNVDLTFSDNSSIDSARSVGLSSHLYYLVSDTILSPDANALSGFNDLATGKKITITANRFDETQINDYKSEDNYNYYLNSNYKMTPAQIKTAISATVAGNVVFSKQLDLQAEYESFDMTGYSKMQSFIFNNLVNAKVTQLGNGTGYAMIEYRFNREDNAYNATYGIDRMLSDLNDIYLPSSQDMQVVHTFNKQVITGQVEIEEQTRNTGYTTYIIVLKNKSA
ncbi:MAG: transglutaminase domain-containing protein [Clostridia bacterium]|nr:transglutaminase domain-containing protein [Clostridia bacterium]